MTAQMLSGRLDALALASSLLSTKATAQVQQAQIMITPCLAGSGGADCFRQQAGLSP